MKLEGGCYCGAVRYVADYGASGALPALRVEPRHSKGAPWRVRVVGRLPWVDSAWRSGRVVGLSVPAMPRHVVEDLGARSVALDVARHPDARHSRVAEGDWPPLAAQ